MKNVLITLGKINPLYRWAPLGGILFVMVVAYYFTVYMDHQSTMEQLSDQYTRKKAEFSRMVVLVKDRGQYMEEVEDLNRELKVAVSMLPDKKEIPSLLKKISEEAEKFGLEINFFQPKGENKKQFYADVPVNIKLKGSFHEVLSFFNAVNKLARIVNVSNIEMKGIAKSSRGRKKGGSKVKGGAFSAFQPNRTELDVSFKATTYRFLTPAEMPKKGGKRGK